MKGNREQIYEFVKLHSSVNANHGISTNEIAEALGMQRTNVSTALGELLREGRVKKSSSRLRMRRERSGNWWDMTAV